MRIASFVMMMAREVLVGLEALGWLAVSWMIVRVMRFQQWSRLLGIRDQITPHVSQPESAAQRVRRVKRALKRVGRLLPPLNNCLVQSLSGRFMLRRRRIPCTVYIGVVKLEHSATSLDVGAHAWLRSGDIYVVKRLATPGIVELAQFGDDPA